MACYCESSATHTKIVLETLLNCISSLLPIRLEALTRPPPPLFFLFFFFFLGLHVWHLEVPRLGAELGLQLPAYTTGTAMPDLSSVCDLHHSSRHHHIPNPLIKPASSWVLVRFVTAEPQWKNLTSIFYGRFIPGRNGNLVSVVILNWMASDNRIPV